MSAKWQILEGDASERLQELPDGCVQTCVTSPPYYGLRDYGVATQLGLEPTPERYVQALARVFDEVWRVLRPDGTLWLNLGDSYTTGGGHAGPGHTSQRHGRDNLPQQNRGTTACPNGFKPKDLLGIPWMVAFALRESGWYLRSDIVWSKPNPMPESVTDRPTRAHEFVFLLSKSPQYYYDAHAIREPGVDGDHPRNETPALDRGQPGASPHSGLRCRQGRNGLGRNRRSVWSIATQPYAGAHFATFPPQLVEPCILAGTAPQACRICGAPWERVVERTRIAVREGPGRAAARVAAGHASGSRRAVTGTMTRPPQQQTTGWRAGCEHDDDRGRCLVLDPFSGAGTVGLVALRHDRSYKGVELNPSYVRLSTQRILDDAPLLNAAAQEAA